MFVTYNMPALFESCNTSDNIKNLYLIVYNNNNNNNVPVVFLFWGDSPGVWNLFVEIYGELNSVKNTTINI